MNYRKCYQLLLYLTLVIIGRTERYDRFVRKHWFQTFTLGVLSTVLAAQPGFGAEQVFVSYGPLEFSIPVTSLETYVTKGRIDDKLAVYAQYFKPQQLVQLRSLLGNQVKFSQVSVAQFLYSSLGETSLQFLGELIQTDSRLNGFYAIRASVILAAADSEGLTLLNAIKKFPTRIIRIETTRLLQVVRALNQLSKQTNLATAVVKQQSALETIAKSPVNSTQEQVLQQPGSQAWQKATLTLNDRRRSRQFIADLYLPNLPTPAPLMIVSHGLGADRKNFASLAQHLASHGFAVAVLDHPGSNSQKLRDLLSGAAKELIEPSELIDRPLDVSYLLNELQRLSQPKSLFPNRFNLQQVGMLGHSIGGYTALALAGSEINFAQLRQVCHFKSEKITQSLANISLLVQCLALNLPPKTTYNFYEPRIQAVIALNPLTSSIFGQQSLQQIQIPIMFVAGSNDVLSPALLEQICPFTWFDNPNKYLVLFERGTHFYANRPLPGIDGLANPNPALTLRYLKALSLAFAKTYVAEQPRYRPYLSAAYSRTISQSPIPLWLVRSLPVKQLQKSQLPCSAVE
jgi:predicted dienelactone hydrolase